jgi:hypothetical protein
MSLDAAEPTLAKSRQCVLVVARDWSSSRGTLRLLERASASEAWRIARGPVPVLLGRHGLAPGPASDPLGAPAGLRKHEGDGRAPAGIFALGPAFGFAPHATRMPFVLVTPTTVAVDDSRSRFYNQIVDTATVGKPDWRSAEKMHAIPFYHLGLVVAYNTAHAAPDAGSCIFLHCLARPPKTTSGCTAMPDAEMAALLTWLDPAAQPRLVQMPGAAYDSVRRGWSLPELRSDE